MKLAPTVAANLMHVGPPHWADIQANRISQRSSQVTQHAGSAHFMVLDPASIEMQRLTERAKDLVDNSQRELVVIGGVGYNSKSVIAQSRIATSIVHGLGECGYSVRYVTLQVEAPYRFRAPVDTLGSIGIIKKFGSKDTGYIDPERFINKLLGQLAKSSKHLHEHSIEESITDLICSHHPRVAFIPMFGDDWRALSRALQKRDLDVTYETTMYPRGVEYSFVQASISGSLTEPASVSLLNAKKRWTREEKVHAAFDTLAFDAIVSIGERVYCNDPHVERNLSLLKAACAHYFQSIDVGQKEAMLIEAAQYLACDSIEKRKQFFAERFPDQRQPLFGATYSCKFEELFVSRLMLHRKRHGEADCSYKELLRWFVERNIFQATIPEEAMRA